MRKSFLRLLSVLILLQTGCQSSQTRFPASLTYSSPAQDSLWTKNWRVSEQDLVIKNLQDFELNPDFRPRQSFILQNTQTSAYRLFIKNTYFSENKISTRKQKYFESELTCDEEFAIEKSNTIRHYSPGLFAKFRLYDEAYSSEKVVFKTDSAVSQCTLYFKETDSQKKFGVKLLSEKKLNDEFSELYSTYEKCQMPSSQSLFGLKKIFLSTQHSSLSCPQQISNFQFVANQSEIESQLIHKISIAKFDSIYFTESFILELSEPMLIKFLSNLEAQAAQGSRIRVLLSDTSASPSGASDALTIVPPSRATSMDNAGPSKIKLKKNILINNLKAIQQKFPQVETQNWLSQTPILVLLSKDHPEMNQTIVRIFTDFFASKPSYFSANSTEWSKNMARVFMSLWNHDSLSEAIKPIVQIQGLPSHVTPQYFDIRADSLVRSFVNSNFNIIGINEVEENLESLLKSAQKKVIVIADHSQISNNIKNILNMAKKNNVNTILVSNNEYEQNHNFALAKAVESIPARIVLIDDQIIYWQLSGLKVQTGLLIYSPKLNHEMSEYFLNKKMPAKILSAGN